LIKKLNLKIKLVSQSFTSPDIHHSMISPNEDKIPEKNDCFIDSNNTSTNFLISGVSENNININKSVNNLIDDNSIRKGLISSNSMRCMCNCSIDSHNLGKTSLALKDSQLVSNNPPLSSNDTVSTHVDDSVSLILNLNTKTKSKKFSMKNKNVYNLTENDFDFIIKKNFGKIIEKLSSAIDKTEMHAIEKDQIKLVENEWSDFTLILDRLLFIIFTSLTIISTLTIFLMSPHL
jgi:hypothetical protein